MVSTFALLTLLSASPQGSELWLVRPLYPGQELLVGRTEDAIRELMPPDLRAGEVIGKQELERHLSGKVADLACLLGDARCAEPVGSLIDALGFSRVVLVKGGQDESGYVFKVATFTPASAEVATAEGSGPSLGKALTGALVKVVPLAGTLEVATEPPGMAVFVDGERVGQTPLSTQVLPGERNVRVEGPFYVPMQIKQVIPVRGRASLRPKLEKTPARLTITVQPVEAQIFLDGEVAGAGALDRGISAGAHVVRVALGDYDPQEVPIVAKPGETVTLGLKMSQGGLAALNKEAYERSWDIIALGDIQHITAGSMSWVQGTGPQLEGDLTDLALQGVELEIGSYDNYLGFTIAGVQYAKSMHPAFFTAPGASAVEMDFTRYEVSAFQFRARFHFWHLQAFAQAGLDFMMLVGQPVGGTSADAMKAYSLGLSGRAALRAFPFKGLFVEVAYGGRFNLPVPIGKVPAQQGLLGGIGYAF
ncbi:MAG TPA: PEGA domain-containing protein [Myxococcaceae bacterium]|nr:PEGA domain-containing protein [Myxococcaceae bacterium]